MLITNTYNKVKPYQSIRFLFSMRPTVLEQLDLMIASSINISEIIFSARAPILIFCSACGKSAGRILCNPQHSPLENYYKCRDFELFKV